MGDLKITCKPITYAAEQEMKELFFVHELKMLKQGKLKGFAAFYERMPVGILLYREQEKCLVLERIFVKPGYRRNGIGKEMLAMLCKFSKASKQRFLFSFDAVGNRDVFYRFVASTHDFVIKRQQGYEAYLTKEEVLDIGKKNPVKAGTTELYFEQTNAIKEEFITYLSKSYPMIAWELKHDNGSYRKDLCCCIIEKGTIQSVSLIKEVQGELELKLMYGRPGKGTHTAKALMGAFNCLNEENVLPLRISPMTEAEIKILNFICPEYEITKRFYVAYYLGVSES